MQPDPSTVLIFSNRVLPLSNTFVADQGNNLPTYQPVYIGLRKNNDGLDLIGHRPYCIMEQYSSNPFLSRMALDGFKYITPNWLRALENLTGNVVHAHFGKGGYYCAPIAEKLDIPLVTSFHGSDVTQKDKFSYNQKHRNTTFTRSEKIIAISRFIKRKLIERGCPEEKIIQHYGGIDNLFFAPGRTKHKEPTVLFAGRLIEQKGCQYLLKAMNILHRQLPDAQLIVAGYGVYQSKLQAMSADMNNVRFIGPQNREQIKNEMCKAWVTCLPSIVLARGNEEGLSTVALESQAVGTPVVGFDTGGVGEAVLHGETGLLSEQRNSELLADNLLQLLDSGSLREKMSQAGVERVDKYFNIYKQCEKLEAIYRAVHNDVYKSDFPRSKAVEYNGSDHVASKE